MPARPSRIGVNNVQLTPSPTQVIDAAHTTQTWPYASWVDWYNRGASADDQNLFDRVTCVLDEGGAPYMPGGAEQDYIEKWRFTRPSVYPALASYRDTGGRRALFAAKTKSYGDKPISSVRPDGPIVLDAAKNAVLHPGRYTYSVVSSQGDVFTKWLDAAVGRRDAQVLRTQVAEEPSMVATLLGYHTGTLYRDYEFLVAVDLPWSKEIPGLPSWLPPGVDVAGYWGKPSSKVTPNLEELKKAAEKAKEAFMGIASLALLGGAGYVLFLLASLSKTRRSTA